MNNGLPPTRVLIVDDYPDVLEVWTLYLRAVGFDVAAAADGGSALRLARAETPDIVVLDLQLPDVSGLDVARQLRGDVLTAAVPLIALTGRAMPNEIAEAHDAGFDAVLVKPCEPAQLLQEIHRILAAR
jgi:CheY-like chemotaxis protein